MNRFIEFCKKTKIYIENNHKNVPIALGYFLLILIGSIDCLVPPDISLSVFYLAPVSLITWFVSQEAGLLTCFLSAIAWFISDLNVKTTNSHFFIHSWNAVVQLASFLIFSDLLFKWHKALDKEKELERIDSTTGIANERLFFELARLELKKSERYRHPLTIIYIDIDGFRTINNRLGSSIGDKLLHTVAKTIKNQIRETDILARLGGDEFVILLPGSGYEPGHIVIDRVQKQLLSAMQKNGWAATFSIGGVTFINPPNSVDAMIQRADHLMYSIKNNGKNHLKHITSV